MFQRIHHLEICVGNPKQASHYYRHVCGFDAIARSGFETGNVHESSIAMRQNEIVVLLTSALCNQTPAAEYLRQHGEGVCDVAFEVTDASAAFNHAVSGGALPVQPPKVVEDEWGAITRATVGTPGSMTHSLIQRNGYKGAFLPGMQPVTGMNNGGVGLIAVDHVAVSIQRSTLNEWVDFYGRAFGFSQTRSEQVATEYSGMNSRVMEASGGSIRIPLTEPMPGRRRSQIDEYLTFNGGAGVQHAAFLTDNIVRTVRLLKEAGLDFLMTPGAYYEALQPRVGTIRQELASLRELGILADRDGDGYLLQIFSRALNSRPTFFLEIIERNGSAGFGSGNIRALYEAVEREQSLRQPS